MRDSVTRAGWKQRISLLGTLLFSASFLLACAATGGPGKNQALIKASRKGDKAEVISLIREGADINAQDPEGWTPYLAASAAGNWEIMHLLQGMGCKTDPGF
jgi:ankyrin repeat protein